jgi:outer membrane lipoprotein-sorting protein
MRSIFFAAVLTLAVFFAVGTAQAQENEPATLEGLQKKLNDMDKKLDLLLQGQKESVEEHQQIRAWCRR